MTFGGNHIAELCAELVPYGILIKIDHLLKSHTTEMAQKELEAAFWQFLRTLQASHALGRATTRQIDRMYMCLGCRYSTIFKEESEEHEKLKGHNTRSIPFTPE